MSPFRRLLYRFLPRGLHRGIRFVWNIAELPWLRTGEEKILEQQVRPGFVVIDAGAAIGSYTRHLSRLVGPAGRVYAIEPMPDAFRALDTSRRLYGWRNVETIQAGLSDEPGEAFMSVPLREDGVPSFYEARIDAASTSGVPVRVITLDSLSLSRVDFIKIDVEGHELPVLRGARETLERCRPRLLIEIWSEEAPQFLRTIGYAEIARSGVNILYEHVGAEASPGR